MVVKPSEFVVRGKKGMEQPAVKCRGREYLRIISSKDANAGSVGYVADAASIGVR